MYSHHLMAIGFAAACLALLRIGRTGWAILCLAAVAEAYASIRYPIHSAVRDTLLDLSAHHIAKVELQTVMLVLMIGAIVAGVALMLPRLARMPMGRQMMTLGGLVIVAMFGVELVSLHPIDAIIYQMIGPFAICAIFYFVGALFVAGGALVEGRRRSAIGQSV